MNGQLPTRQRIRKALILFSLLIFPITMNYFSPYVIIDGAARGIVSGSFIFFGLLFMSALFFGRLWCGWACPAAGLNEAAAVVNNRPVNLRWLDPIKWLIWFPWLILIGVLAVQAGGYRQVNILHLTESGISVDEPEKYFIYLTVVGVFLGLSLAAGRRASCHSICWMAPFMILGRKIRNLFAWPALRLTAGPAACRDW
jgi:ferredoxin-type protein NapH